MQSSIFFFTQNILINCCILTRMPEDLEPCCSCRQCSHSPLFFPYEMKLAKINTAIVFLVCVFLLSRLNENPSLTVHQPSLKHNGIPQMNISLLKAFFRTMPLTVLISQSLLSAARLANEQPR